MQLTPSHNPNTTSTQSSSTRSDMSCGTITIGTALTSINPPKYGDVTCQTGTYRSEHCDVPLYHLARTDSSQDPWRVSTPSTTFSSTPAAHTETTKHTNCLTPSTNSHQYCNRAFSFHRFLKLRHRYSKPSETLGNMSFFLNLLKGRRTESPITVETHERMNFG